MNECRICKELTNNRYIVLNEKRTDYVFCDFHIQRFMLYRDELVPIDTWVKRERKKWVKLG